jgi:putative DNA primase/helicase
MHAAGEKAQAGQETRLADIPSDTGKYGVFEDLHGHESGEAFARALTQAAHTYHGAAGREFLRHLTGLRPDEVAERVEALRKDFMKENVPQSASGQVQRVAMRFALAAAGGELATKAGITGWSNGEAIKAAVRCFKDWPGCTRRCGQPGGREGAIPGPPFLRAARGGPVYALGVSEV